MTHDRFSNMFLGRVRRGFESGGDWSFRMLTQENLVLRIFKWRQLVLSNFLWGRLVFLRGGVWFFQTWYEGGNFKKLMGNRFVNYFGSPFNSVKNKITLRKPQNFKCLTHPIEKISIIQIAINRHTKKCFPINNLRVIKNYVRGTRNENKFINFKRNFMPQL